MIGEARLGLLGLGMRAGKVVVGTNGVRAALQRGEIELVIVAEDCSRRTEEKVVRLARAINVPTVTGPAARALGHRLGRPPVQAVGVRDAQLVAGLTDRGEPADARRT
jgi:ribosomal protein L7Ae-like RNA K-turn-binding protein